MSDSHVPSRGDRKSAVDFLRQGISTGASNQQLAYQLIGSSAWVDGTFAEGWYHLSNANHDMGLSEASVTALRRALYLPDGKELGDMTPDLRLKALINFGHRLFHIGKLAEARKVLNEALALDKNAAFAWVNMSLIECVEDNRSAAIECAKKAHDLEPGNPTIQTGLAFAYLFGRDYKRGLKHFEARFAYKLPHFLSYPYPKWTGQSTVGKTLFLVADQGLGDTLSFARFVPQVAKRFKKIVMMIQQPLVRLFEIWFQAYENIEIQPLPSPFPPADYWSTFVSLPFALDLSSSDIIDCPGLPVPNFTVPTKWREESARYHIGVCWAGAPENGIDKWRSFDVKWFLELYRVPGVQLYSLQIGPHAADVHSTGSACLIRDTSPHIRDVCDTMAIVKDLDLVITAETALGHICGAMGKECWVPYSYAGGDWRIGRNYEKPIWYPNHRVFRQGPDMSWQPVFDRIVAELDARVNGVSEENCPGHVASDADPKICAHCGTHIDSLRPEEVAAE